jgi:hypothetical protein
VFNAIVGRYANQLKNGKCIIASLLIHLKGHSTDAVRFILGTFSIPILRIPTPGGLNVYQISTNAHNGDAPDARTPYEISQSNNEIREQT